MKRKLAMDDIRVGMFVTILEGKKREIMVPMGRRVIKENDNYKGDILEIIAVDMPYVAIEKHAKSRIKHKDVLDLREVKLMQLDPIYIQVLLPDLRINKNHHFWDEIKDTSLKEADTTIEEIFKDL